jgi:hypothetical protein
MKDYGADELTKGPWLPDEVREEGAALPSTRPPRERFAVMSAPYVAQNATRLPRSRGDPAGWRERLSPAFWAGARAPGWLQPPRNLFSRHKISMSEGSGGRRVCPLPLPRRCPPTRRGPAPPRPQDALLLRCVAKHGPKNWSLIARSIPGRTGKSCRLRCARVWQRPQRLARATGCIAACRRAHAWCFLAAPGTAAQVHLQPAHVPETADGSRAAAWCPADAAANACSRAGRWLNQLNPNVKKEPFSGEEDAIIMAAHTMLGNKWASISKLLVGRCAARRARAWQCGRPGCCCSVAGASRRQAASTLELERSQARQPHRPTWCLGRRGASSPPPGRTTA